MWRDEQTTDGKPALCSGRPGDTRNRGRPRTRWIISFMNVIFQRVHVLLNVDKCRSIGNAYVQWRSFNGCRKLNWTELNWDSKAPGGVGHGARDQFCPIASLQMADWFFHFCAGSVCDFLRFSPFINWFTIIFFGKVWVDRCSKLQFLKQYDVCLFSIDIVRCNSSCA